MARAWLYDGFDAWLMSPEGKKHKAESREKQVDAFLGSGEKDETEDD